MAEKKIKLKDRAGNELFPQVKMVDEPTTGQRSDYFANGAGGWSIPAGGSGGGHTYVLGQPSGDSTVALYKDGSQVPEAPTVTINNVQNASAASSVPWSGVTNKPSNLIQGTTVGLTAINTICVLDRATYEALTPQEKLSTTMYVIRG